MWTVPHSVPNHGRVGLTYEPESDVGPPLEQARKCVRNGGATPTPAALPPTPPRGMRPHRSFGWIRLPEDDRLDLLGVPWLRSEVPSPAPTLVCAASLFAMSVSATQLHAESASSTETQTRSATQPPETPSEEERELASEPLERARAARQARDAAQRDGNAEAAARAARLAERWEAAARELIRAIRAERRAKQLQKESLDLEQKIARARALLEETLARRGRARTALTQIKDPARTEKKP